MVTAWRRATFVLLVGLALCACQEREDAARARDLARLETAWQAIQHALDARDLAGLASHFHPLILADYPKAPDWMIHIRHSDDLAGHVQGEIRAAIIDPPLAILSTATAERVEAPTDWVWCRVGEEWKLVGNRDVVNLANLMAGRRPLLREDAGD